MCGERIPSPIVHRLHLALAAGIVVALVACRESRVRVGAVRVRTQTSSAYPEALLFVDALPRGPVRDGVELELPPGSHVFEARSGTTVLAAATVEVRSALRCEAVLSLPTREPVPDPLPTSATDPAPASIADVVARERPSLQACYERTLSRNRPNPTLRITLGLDVARDGTVTRADAEGAAPTSLLPCVEAAARRWRFGALDAPTSVELPVVFSPHTLATELPPTPSRTDVRAALASLLRPASECAADNDGVVTLNVTFEADGRVSRVSAAENELSASEERCVLDAARRLNLPAFSQERFFVTFPVRY
jgi:hypothetical protein